MENQEMEIQTMENNLVKDMPQAPTTPKLPKYFPDLQGENRGRKPYGGWYQNELLPWIQNQDPIQLVGLFLYGGLTLIVISTFTSFQLLLTMWAITIYHSYFGK